MALIQAEDILIRAKGGEKVQPNERRHAIAYLFVKEPDTTNVALADIFGVDEKVIRKDKIHLRTEKAKEIKSEDVGLIIADIHLCFEKVAMYIERSRRKCDLGTRTYLDHCKAIFRMKLDMTKAMQDLGWLPKNLGNMTVENFQYEATVGKDGSVNTRPVDLKFDEQGEILDIDFEESEQLALPEPDED